MITQKTSPYYLCSHVFINEKLKINQEESSALIDFEQNPQVTQLNEGEIGYESPSAADFEKEDSERSKEEKDLLKILQVKEESDNGSHLTLHQKNLSKISLNSHNAIFSDEYSTKLLKFTDSRLEIDKNSVDITKNAFELFDMNQKTNQLITEKFLFMSDFLKNIKILTKEQNKKFINENLNYKIFKKTFWDFMSKINHKNLAFNNLRNKTNSSKNRKSENN